MHPDPQELIKVDYVGLFFLLNWAFSTLTRQSCVLQVGGAGHGECQAESVELLQHLLLIYLHQSLAS